MKTTRLHLGAMLLFILGFVCTNSGWGPLLAIWASDRPEWSVCGEDLCLCVEPDEDTPGCPLCVAEELRETSCLSALRPEPEPKPEPRPRRVPRNPHEKSISKAGELGCVSVFIAFAFGTPAHTRDAQTTNAVRFPEPDARLALNLPDIPTPPPRS